MKVFKKIFKFSEEQIKIEMEKERRSNVRYKPSMEFPLMMYLEDQKGNYGCEILDISFGGMKVKLDEEHNFKIEDIISIKVTLQSDIFYYLKAKVAYAGSEELGLQILPEIYESINNYFQSILPVYIGKSLTEYSSGKSLSEGRDILKRVFYGHNNSSLTFWLDGSNKILEFEFNMDEYVIRGQTDKYQFNVYTVKEDLKNDKMSTILNKKYDSKKTKEIITFFSWVVMNIKDNLSDDLVQYFKNFSFLS